MQAYTVKEQLRDVLRADTRTEMELGLKQVLRRTARRANVPMRKLHESLLKHFDAIAALGGSIHRQVESKRSTTTGRPLCGADAVIATFRA
jgi:hypothetical protein